ncbi:geranylgeranyl transferase type-2 subunit alpha-like isoform X4 [Hydractinia symbiolongicarpus]|uniref:geranylgeranyl transferase type-2 subunit alpha-like isoform X4 n=1 Tax=Hydractinia symbiolongicarpus TaxID=13093 RepID=UPI00254A3F19|nr:geranylgeranyl transferase type-2 subunit alpha-like isoform X4 [Hydractinia symbiolongicarpus]
MHGRLKVKTTAEQQEEKRKEREKKSAIFLQLMKGIFEKRGKKDEFEATLKLSEKLLSGNPDVYTLWNIRKEIFVEMQKQENIDKLLHMELKFLQSCLHVNPKSYGVWNQRQFVMLTMEKPDWHEELRLCNLFLEYDERNFHCWDYRRFVVKNSMIAPEDEFQFTTKKISENFSNYSAWHNRSKLLPLINPDPNQPDRVAEDTLLKEFELAQNAFFTDPNDQSAWFYQRWLLGRKPQAPRLLSLSLLRSSSTVIASFSLPVNIALCNSFTMNNETKDIQWKSIESLHNGANVIASCVWEATVHSCVGQWIIYQRTMKICSGTMLTIIYLMRALGGEGYIKDTEELLTRLIKTDSMRAGYYKDLRSKYRIENELQRLKKTQDNLTVVNLSGKELTSFPYSQYFTSCETIDLSDNCLKDISFCSLLPGVENIILKNNKVGDKNVEEMSSMLEWKINITV